MTFESLPQLSGGLFLGDGGIETSLIFLQGAVLPEFASFVLVLEPQGRDKLRKYYEPFLELCASTPDAGFVLDTPTWRASADWGSRLGYDARALDEINRAAVELALELRKEWQTRIARPIVISGVIGPRGDGYLPETAADTDAAETFHLPQAISLKEAGVDMLSALTMTSIAEAMGVARAARSVGLPASISFTVETDGRLPSGEGLREAIESVDADAAPAYFGVNCAHTSHFDACFSESGAWVERIKCIRSNASARSHAELDGSAELDIGDPADLASRYVRLRKALPEFNVVGGCCGTDHRHLRAIRDGWLV
jgi:homocysteine S-methyltransferase